MPDTSPGAGTASDGPDGPALEGAADNRGSLDVPEWVSELRRLYVEPKTRATLRQEGVIAPHKRRLGLPSGRGSRRGTTDAPPTPGAVEQTAPAAAVPVPVAPQTLRPAVLEPADAPQLLDDSGAPYTPPDRTEEEKVATWLTSYLVATGHAADEEAAAVDSGEAATAPLPVVPDVSAQAAQAARPAAADAAPTRDAGPHVLLALSQTADEAALAAPLDLPAPATVEAIAHDAEPTESHPRSLADLAGLSEPDRSPAGDLHGEPGRIVHEGAGVLVSTGGDAATPNPAVTSRPEPHLDHPPTSSDPEPALAAQPPLPEEPLEEASVEPLTVPGRPSTVPAVTLSWREAESFEIGVPGVEDSERAIVVEPPSQLVAERRIRRRDLDTEHNTAVDQVIVQPLPAPVPVEAAPATRASARAASGYQSGKRRRVMVVGLVLVMLALVAWYFLLRGDGEDAAIGSNAPAGASHAVVVLSPTGPGSAAGPSLV